MFKRHAGEAVSADSDEERNLILCGKLFVLAYFVLAPFHQSQRCHRSGMYKLTTADDGVLHAGFLRQFDDMWRQARREDER